MSKKKNKVKPAKVPMKHKPKVTRDRDGTETRPYQFSSHAQEIAVRALQAANLNAVNPQAGTSPTSQLPSDKQRVVESLINTLPAVLVDPEARVGEIYFIYRRNRVDVDPATEQRIEEGRFQAHVGRTSIGLIACQHLKSPKMRNGRLKFRVMFYD